VKAVIITYVVKKGRENEFIRVLRKHWKVLRSEGLTTNQLPFILRDPENPSVFKEIFEWKSQRSFTKAHESEKVQKVWNELMRLTFDGGIEAAYFQRM
jgi:hypothetical protein